MTTVYRDKINLYQNKLTEYEGKLVTVGLSEKDRIDIITILKRILADKTHIKQLKERCLLLKRKMEEVNAKISNGIQPFSTEFQCWCYHEDKEEYEDLRQYIEQIDSIETSLYNIAVLLYNKVHVITPREFILRNSMLTHLVYTNNEWPIIKPTSADSYMFLCQFHCEKTPSMIVNNSRNFLQCFGCGEILDSIEYLMRQEDLTEEDAISVLANIYYLNYPDKKEAIPELQKKYIRTLLSADFKALLEKGYNRTKLKDRSIFVTNGIVKFEQDFETIKRVESGQVKDYVFEDKPKKFVKIK